MGSHPSRVIPKTIIKMVQTASLLGTQTLGYTWVWQPNCLKGRVCVWNCLWRHALKRSAGINHKSSVLYPCPEFLFSATWSSMLKRHSNGLINHYHQFASGCGGAVCNMVMICMTLGISAYTRLCRLWWSSYSCCGKSRWSRFCFLIWSHIMNTVGKCRTLLLKPHPLKVSL